MSTSMEPKTIESIRLGILSPSLVRKFSVLEVMSEETYDEDGMPISGGVMDQRLGTIEPGQRCKTCGNLPTRCPGHFGHIELPEPVVNVLFVKQIQLLLSTTCRSCGRILLPNDRIEFYQEQIRKLMEGYGAVPERIYGQIVREAKRMSTCPHCGESQYFIKPIKPTGFFEVSPEGVTTKLTPNMIRERLERISNEDLKLLRLDPEVARPEWMILQALPVPPVQVRPSIILETGERSEDDLTHKLVDIVRTAKRVKEYKDNGASPLIVQDHVELLQYHVTTYLDNEASGVPPSRHRTNKILRTLAQRLKGKEGRFRKNLSGKRVDFSARTVISPDPNLEIEEVGVPVEVAMKLTVPEQVNQYNKEYLSAFVKNGPFKYPGALYVIRPDGGRIRLDFVKDLDKLASSLDEGFIVERHLIDGDVVVFNRQPSLHRISMMGHRVRVLPYRTFRLHPAVCPPYNADFDGDEMNLHVPQSIEASTEAKELLSVGNNYITPRYGAPIIGAIRDFITSVFLLTRRGTYLTKEEMLTLAYAANKTVEELPPPEVKEPVPLWSGKQAFSMLLPEDFDFSAKAKFCAHCESCKEEECPYDAYIKIVNGKLISGAIDQASVGAERPNTILHNIILRYGHDLGNEFLSSLTKMASAFVQLRGFSLTFRDFVLPEEVLGEVRKLVGSSDEKVREIVDKYRAGKLQRIAGLSDEESIEAFIMNALSEIRSEAGSKVSDAFGFENNMVAMTKTGARGSDLNIGQIAACLGQQSLRGKRVSKGYHRRPLPHFAPGDISPPARGFVASNYLEGLSPTEFFYHAMSGRESLVDTAVRTQQSGYLQRRLIHALETLRVEYDLTVRDAYGNVVEFTYGDDGLDPSKIFHGKLEARNIIEPFARVRGTTVLKASDVEEAVEQEVGDLPASIKRDLISCMVDLKVPRSRLREAIRYFYLVYRRSCVEPGENVGIVAAQSIGEPGTQMTLRTFHYAGIREANVTLGLPRLIEILDARKIPKTPVMRIYLDEKHRKSEKLALEVAKKIVHTTLDDVSSNIEIDYKRGAILIEPSLSELEDRGMKLEDLVQYLNEAGFRPKVLSDNTLVVRPSEEDQNLEELAEKLRRSTVCGVEQIGRVILSFSDGEWVLTAEGSNLKEVLEFPGVDPTRTTTNNIHEIAEVLGIEAARAAIIKEISETLQEQGLDVDLRHISLVASAMTASGQIKQIGRHGLSGEKVSVFARAAFERTLQTLAEGAASGVEDRMRGMTERVLSGQEIKSGTSMVEVYIDMLGVVKG